jgi:uncharacterized OB-fold protein
MSAGGLVVGVLIAVTTIRTAPEGFEPNAVLAVVEAGGQRHLCRLQVADDVMPSPGQVVHGTTGR